MARITEMINISEILRRLRAQEGTNRIKRELGVHKTVIKRVREMAASHNWLDANTPLPDEHTLFQAYKSLFKKESQPHILDPYLDEITTWRENKESFVVIRHKLNDRLGSPLIKDTALRDYFRRKFPKILPIVMRRETEYGIAELDFGYLGRTIDDGGKRRKTWFTSVRFRASREAYREKVFRTDIRTVIKAIQNAFNAFGGVPRVLVIDNFKAAVAKAHLYDPTITKSFYEFAKHTGFLLSPCKPFTARHKGGVESDVKYVKGNFLPLVKDYEKQRGFDIIRAEILNERFAWWNREHARKRRIREAGNRSVEELFSEEFEHLRELPQTPYEPVEWATVKVRLDWHVQYASSYYSVPYKNRGKSAEIRASSQWIEVFIEHELIARHRRNMERGRRVTVKEHGPTASMEYLESSRSFILDKALKIGVNAEKVVRMLLDDSVIDRRRSALGIVFLTKRFPAERIEKACVRALFFNISHYHNVKNILEKNMEDLPMENPVDARGQMFFVFSRDESLYH